MLKRLAAWRLKEPSVVMDVESLTTPSALTLHSVQQIKQLEPTVQRLLIYEFNLGELASRMCPVLLADQRVAIFAIAEHSVGDAYQALLSRVRQQGYSLADPSCYVVSVSLLLELIRDPQFLGPQSMNVAMTTPWNQADLFNAFLDIVRWGYQHQASDIHLNVFMQHRFSEVRFSIAGRYVSPAKFHNMSTQFLLDMLAVAWMNIQGGNGAVFDPYKEQQGSLVCDLEGQILILRWGALAAERGPSVCLRLLARDAQRCLPSLQQLGYLPEQQQILQQALLGESGAVIFSGAVGSGKSTTLAALVSQLPFWRKLISLEDPVEYLIPNAVQVSLSRDLHHDSHHVFSTKLRALKRSAMTDVLLGEIRDVETGRAFTDLSSSGVRLYTTVHAASAALVPARLHSDFIGVSLDLLAAPGILRLLVHQCLLPRLCTHCALNLSTLNNYPSGLGARYGHTPFKRWQQQLVELVGAHIFDQLRVRNSQGCPQCVRPEFDELAGWSGRIVCAELLQPQSVPGYLAALHQQQSLPQILQKVGWRDLRYSALKHVQQGVVDPFDVETHFALFSSGSWSDLQGVVL